VPHQRPPYGPLGGFLAISERRLADLDTSG
jgi:hypothetical protein